MKRIRGPPRGAQKTQPSIPGAGGRREGLCRTGMSIHAESRNNPNRFKEKAMRKAQTFAKKITEWELINTNLKPHLQDMPYLQEIVTALDTLIAEAKTLDSQQEMARGQLQDLTHKRQDTEKQGESLRRRAASHLKGTFGFTSDELVKFGVRPRKTGPRGPRKTKPAVEPAVSSK